MPTRALLTRSQCVEILSQLRDARALLLRDNEAFHQAVITLEHVGQILSSRIGSGLGAYKQHILEHADQGATITRSSAERLFQVVKDARNMAVHDGAWARHLSSRLIDLLLALEDATMSTMTLVEDIMVRTPFVAEPWYLIGHIRKMMLSNSFSTIPLLEQDAGEKRWSFLTDRNISHMLRSAPEQKETRLGMRVDTAIKKGLIKTEEAVRCRPEDKISTIIATMNNLPLLVIDPDNRLVGILTSFDLL
jgi:predicted transcriptional regulator